jgi:hypothetical protein
MKLLKVILLSAFFICSQAYADQWDYKTTEDKMTGKTTSMARLSSNNSLSLSAPYSGLNYGYLTIRKHPQYGLDVIVSISKGQILCRSYSGCSVKVKFGNDQPMTFSATGPADHSSTTIFLNNSQKFIDQAKKTTHIKVQLMIYHAGDEVLEFDSLSPLAWGSEPKKPTESKSK